MKNIQVIDGAQNAEYAVYEISDKQFAFIFPGPNQDIEFIEDVVKRHGEKKLIEVFEGIWDRKLKKCNVNGIHGTLFYQLLYKKKYYPGKVEANLIGAAPSG